MSFLTQDLPAIGGFTGLEDLCLDTNLPTGRQPQMVRCSLIKLAVLLLQLQNSLSKTMVSGTIYYSSFALGATQSNPPASAGSVALMSPQTFTGMNVAVGTPGGTDNWQVAVYSSAGLLLANSIATLAGTALTFQQILFTAAITLASGNYFLALQGNGTTAKFLAFNAPTAPTGFVTGSQVGVAGTLATLTPLSATYTANLGPMLSLF